MNKKYTIVSLFSGCGGLDLGFQGGFKFLNKKYIKNNFKIIWANDIDKHACETYFKNIKEKIICDDIENILKNKNIFKKDIAEDVDLVVGGFPCQDFSFAGKRQGVNTKRGQLYKSMIKIIKKVSPKMFLVENVKGLLSIDEGKVFNQMIKDFEKIGYIVSYKLFAISDFGIPQKRERIILIGTKKGVLPKFIFPKKYMQKHVCIQDVLADLEYCDEGSVSNHYWSKAKKNKGQGNIVVNKNGLSPTIRSEHHGNIEFHWNEKRRLSAREVARIQSFPDNFVFYSSTTSAYKQVGNAVAPVFAWHIARWVQKFLKENLK